MPLCPIYHAYHHIACPTPYLRRALAVRVYFPFTTTCPTTTPHTLPFVLRFRSPPPPPYLPHHTAVITCLYYHHTPHALRTLNVLPLHTTPRLPPLPTPIYPLPPHAGYPTYHHGWTFDLFYTHTRSSLLVLLFYVRMVGYFRSPPSTHTRLVADCGSAVVTFLLRWRFVERCGYTHFTTHTLPAGSPLPPGPLHCLTTHIPPYHTFIPVPTTIILFYLLLQFPFHFGSLPPSFIYLRLVLHWFCTYIPTYLHCHGLGRFHTIPQLPRLPRYCTAFWVYTCTTTTALPFTTLRLRLYLPAALLRSPAGYYTPPSPLFPLPFLPLSPTTCHWFYTMPQLPHLLYYTTFTTYTYYYLPLQFTIPTTTLPFTGSPCCMGSSTRGLLLPLQFLPSAVRLVRYVCVLHTVCSCSALLPHTPFLPTIYRHTI